MLILILKDILFETPSWVWVVFVYIIVMGIKASKTRSIYLPRIFLTQCIMFGLKYKSYFSSDALTLIPVVIVTTVISFFTIDTTQLKRDTKTTSIIIPGSYQTLVIMLSFFTVKYIFGFLYVTNPTIALKYKLFDLMISGILTGFLLGKSLRFTSWYLKQTS
ncbi:hypothetical protein IPH25_04535 [bacterium]|nr:MAG: hypothetical protein IPG37_01530 [bacterium]QQR61710.1 MAG: hypothetical protein IPH25_04535 [bacterium]QQR62722.1 MAG: hypothetical protein IPH67_04900 [bacterium]